MRNVLREQSLFRMQPKFAVQHCLQQERKTSRTNFEMSPLLDCLLYTLLNEIKKREK